MKNYSLPKVVIALLFSAILYSGCQDPSPAEVKDNIDEQMAAAIADAESFLDESDPTARRRGNYFAVTVLVYDEGTIYYATNTDDVKGYQIVGEETVTATIKPGGYVFWYAGKGFDYISDIIINSAEVNNSSLTGLTSESTPSRLWLVHIPEDISEEDLIKYDIAYRTRSGIEDILDPKIKITTTD